MKIHLKLILVVLISSIIIYSLIYYNANHNITEKSQKPAETKVSKQISIAVVACGINRVDEALVMIKSALIFNKNSHLNFIAITEENLKEIFIEKLKNLRNFYEFSYQILNLKFPSENGDIWMKLFKPCAAQRLFLPTLLPHIDSLIYVDCDVIFLTNPEDLWNHFNLFTSTQIASMTPESESRNTGWYTRFARHPYYGEFGVNSGVMLMNLKRMREINFEVKILPIYEKFKSQLAWGDQDILNIYFHQHEEELRVMNCDFNYRPDFCIYTSQCAIEEGVKVLHGNRGYFHKIEGGKQGIFREIYKGIEEVRF